MIEISQSEAEYIIRHTKHNKMAIASKNKRSGGKTYYVMATDKTSVNFILKLRGLRNKRELFSEEGCKHEQKSVCKDFCKEYKPKIKRN